MNIESLFKVARMDVFEAMTYLGFKTRASATMPEIKIVDTIELSDGNINAKAAYNATLNEIYILKATLNNLTLTYCCICHELTHSFQPREVFTLEGFLPYFHRTYEKEAYMVQTYVYSRLMAKSRIDAVPHAKLLDRLEKSWQGVQLKNSTAA